MASFKFLFLFLSFPIFVFSQVNFVSSNLPIVKINTNGAEILDEPRIYAQMGIINNEDGLNYKNDEYTEYSGKISIEIRGSTSKEFPKKQYALELVNSVGGNNNVSLLGMPKENDWILYAPYTDKSLMRNVISSLLHESMGHYAPRMKHCELILNNEYQGVYVLTEKIKQDSARVNLSELDYFNTDDISGGYLLKIDRLPELPCNSWRTEYGKVNIQFSYPKCTDVNHQQKSYIESYVNSFEKALFADDFHNENLHYTDYIDVVSFVDYFIINELSKNIDAYILSTYVHKESDEYGGKLVMGPIWDYNLAYGNVDYRDGFLHDGFVAYQSPWWGRLVQDSLFCNYTRSRWNELRNDQLSKSVIFSKIDSVSNMLDKAQERNFTAWDILGKDVWPNYFIGQTYSDEISYLKEWFNKRISWLDENIPGTTDVALPWETKPTKIYPSLFENNFTVEFELVENTEVEVCLYSTSGQLLQTVVKRKTMEKGICKIHCNETGNLPVNTPLLAVVIHNGKPVYKSFLIKQVF